MIYCAFDSLGIINDADAVDDYRSMVEILVKQRAALICIRYGCDEIVGLSMNYILLKDESFFEDLNKIVSAFICLIRLVYFNVINFPSAKVENRV